MSERRISLKQRAEVRRYTNSYSSELKPDDVFTVEDALDDLDTADAEIAAQQQHAKDLERLYLELRAQMAGMVTLEQVEKAIWRAMTMPFIVEAGAGVADIIKDTIMDNLRQSAPTKKE